MRDLFMDIKRITLRYILPALAALVAFWGVCDIFFAPQFEGKTLVQGDTRQYTGMWQDIKECREATGEDPQWTGAMFSGMPAYLINVEYPAQIVKRTVGRGIKLLNEPMSMIFFAMLLMWIALLAVGIDPWIGIVASLAYGLSTYFFLIIDAGHITKMWALAYAPLVISGVWCTLRRNMWAGGALTALALSLELGANHPQITYYFALAAAALWLSEMWFARKQRAWRRLAQRTGVLAAAVLLAVGSNFSPLWYTMTHQKYTMRGGSEVALDSSERRNLSLDYATAWSYGKAESLNMLIPGLNGGSSIAAPVDEGEVRRTLCAMGVDSGMTDDLLASGYFGGYWGDQPTTAGPTYLGAVAILLALVGACMTSGRNKWWILAVSLLALLLAWGKNFMGFTELAFKILPGYAKFRTVSMALVIVEWSVPVLAALALRELHRTTLGWRQTAARVAACAGALVVLSLAALALTDGFDTERSINLIRMLVGDSPAAYELRDALTADRRALLTADVWRTVGFVAATAAVITAYAWLRSREWVGPAMRRLLPYAMTVAVGALAVWDLAGVDRRFFNDGNFVDKTMTRIEPSAADRAIMNDTDLGFRVINLDVDPFNDATTSYFHRSVGGYHGAKLGRYQDLIDRYTDVCDGRRSLHPAILAMLDCRYAIYNGQAETLADKCGVEPLGAAWFVSSVRREASAAEQLEALSKVDLATTAVVDADALPGGGEYDAAGEIRLAEYRPNYLRYEYDSEGDALAVFSEIYFPDGWTATIDGAEAPYLRADYTLRAMELPAGRHTVEWRFRAPAWRTVEAVTLISSIAVLAACAAAAAAWIIRLIRRSRHE